MFLSGVKQKLQGQIALIVIPSVTILCVEFKCIREDSNGKESERILDGKTVLPDELVDLKPNTRVVLTIESADGVQASEAEITPLTSCALFQYFFYGLHWRAGVEAFDASVP